MTRSVLALVVTLSALGAGLLAPPAAADEAADVAAVKAQSAVWVVHVAHGDADAAANLYAEDAVVMPDKAPTLLGRAAVRDFLAAMIGEMTGAGLVLKDGPSTEGGVSGDLGWVSGTYSMLDASGATVEVGKYLSVHQRRNGEWHYIRDIWNADAPPAAPAETAPAK